MVGVVDIRRTSDIADDVLADDGTGLIAEGIDAGAVVHVLCVVIDKVGVNLIILHADKVAVPTPTEADASVGNIVNGIVVNSYAIDISGGNGDTAPVLVSDVMEVAVADGLTSANLAEVGGCVGQMGFKAFGREGAADVTVHGDISKGTVCRRATTTSKDVVETRAAEVFEATAVEVDVLSVAQFNSGVGTTEPALIVELVVVGTVNLWAELVCFSEVHASLQGDVTFF